MTPAARIQAVIEALDSSFAENAPPAADCLASFLRGRRYIGSKDRRSITARYWDIWRKRMRLSWLAGSDHPRALLIAHMALAGGQVSSLFTGDKYAPDALTPDEEKLADACLDASLEPEDMPDHVRLECPEWLYSKIDPADLGAMKTEAPLDIRVNSLKTDRDSLIRRLKEEDGFDFTPTPLSPLGARLPERVRLQETGAFKDGWFEIQADGSQMIVQATGAQPGELVADLCAGGGGKTLALAADMENKGTLYACDISKRLSRASKRLARAGVSNAQLITLSKKNDPWVAAHVGKLDRVLVDAPCSGSGTWRHAPDARRRLTPDWLAEITKLQAHLLQQAATLLKPGGTLVYATCSLLACENNAIADGAPFPLEKRTQFRPSQDETDGFFMAVGKKP